MKALAGFPLMIPAAAAPPAARAPIAVHLSARSALRLKTGRIVATDDVTVNAGRLLRFTLSPELDMASVVATISRRLA